MIPKINKHLITFLFLALILGGFSYTVLQKFLPVLLHPTVYYCQSLFHSFSTKIPTQIGMILPTILLLFLGIITGKIILLALKIHSYRKKLITQMISNSACRLLLKNLGIEKKTFLVDNNKPFAFCFGIRKPKIYLSTALLTLVNENELEAILLHEVYHLNNRDTLIMFIASVSESLFFFFPLLSDLLHNYRIEREVKADQAAITHFGNPTILISALHKLIMTPSVAFVPVSAIADEDTLEARIQVLMKNKYTYKTFTIKHMIVSLISMFILVLMTITPVAAVELHQSNQNAMMVCLSGHDCELWCKNHGTIHPYSSVTPMSKNYSSSQ